MSGSQQLLLAAVQQAVATDPDFEYTTLLLPGNGTNGAQNNTFLDSSTNAFSITRNGNTTQGTFSPFSQTGWSNFFDGSGDYLTAANNAAYNFGTGDFTVECWVYVTAYTGPGTDVIVSTYQDSTNGWTIGITSSAFYGAAAGDSAVINSTVAPSLQWFHLVLVRSGTTLAFFVNGARAGTLTNSTNISSTSALTIGTNVGGGALNLNGYMSGLRIVKGTAVYDPTSSTLTVPTAPLTAITNTQLLTCQSNRFVDNSSNAFAITLNGDVSVQAFSPFNPTAAWDAATNGGSGYFDGSGDYLSVARDNVFLPGANTDFTIEAWVYLTATPGATDAQILGFGEYGLNSDYVFAINSSRQLFFYFSSSNTVCANTTTLVPLNAWTYVAVSRSGTGSNNLKVFVNGNAASFSVNSTLVGTGGNNLTIGADANGDESNLTGYITNIRFINGTGYTSLTVPTSPLTAITNTQLLTNFTNAGIYDATSKNDLETVGNAQISTTQSKFGGSSMYFDGTGDYLFAPTSQNLNFRTGDFTIEGWIYLTSNADAYRTILYFTHSSGSTFLVRFGDNTSYNSKFQVAIAVGTASDVYSVNKSMTDLQNGWHHFAFTRSETTCRVFIDGTQENVASGTNPTTFSNASFTNSTDINSSLAPEIGRGGAADTTFVGYIQDLRITRGIARYTASFTAPTAAFPLL